MRRMSLFLLLSGNCDLGSLSSVKSLGPRLKRPTVEIEQSYWYYVWNQSAVIDWLIAARALRALL